MTDIRNLYKMVVEMEQGIENENIGLHDSFDIELNENFVIETGVIGFTRDGIVVEADELALELLEINDVLLESEEQEMLSENPALLGLAGRVAAGAAGSIAGNAISNKLFNSAEPDELDEIKRLSAVNERFDDYDHDSSEEVKSALFHRLRVNPADMQLISDYGLREVMDAVDDISSGVGSLDEIGSSDISAWMDSVRRLLKSQYGEKRERKPAQLGPEEHWDSSRAGEPSKWNPEPGKVQYLTRLDDQMNEAEYQGRKVPLGKPMQGDVKKSKVYVKKPNGKVVKVNFGDKNMTIKKNNPARRKSFRARHNCDNPGPRWKARYWSCRAW
jgi:hypothetical protein